YLDICIYIPQILLFFISLGICFAGLKNKVRTSYVGFAFLYLVVTYSASWMLSGGRYLACNIPLFIILAMTTRTRFRQLSVMLVSASMLAVYTFLFVCNYPVM
ncbi:MAG: hypothetical protein II781_03625, partial [Clostridia bacterium]|nr:hypothetical protein [Clostridia bacterium]